MLTHLLRQNQGYRRIDPRWWIQQDYEEMRDAGQPHLLAEMLALQSAPSLQTDTRFQMGHVNHNQFEKDPFGGRAAIAEAKRKGINIEGAWYSHQMARYPGDPEAWIRNKADVKRLAEKNNMDVEGSVTHRSVDDGTQDPFDKKYEAADELVDKAVSRVEAENPGVSKDVPDLRSMLKAKLSGDA